MSVSWCRRASWTALMCLGNSGQGLWWCKLREKTVAGGTKEGGSTPVGGVLEEKQTLEQGWKMHGDALTYRLRHKG